MSLGVSVSFRRIQLALPPLSFSHTHTYIHTHGLSVVGIKHANCYARILRVHPRDAEDVSTGNSALSVTSDSESGGFSLSSS